MSVEIQNIRLKFKCPANWDEMTPIAGGRFCDHCAKVIYDFTDAKQAEFQKLLAKNGNGFCGRFRTEQTAAETVALPRWKQWLSAAMLLVGVSLSSQCRRELEVISPDSNVGKENVSELDQVIIPKDEDTFTMGVVMMPQPEYPGGIVELYSFLSKNLHRPKGCENVNGKVFISFVVDIDGSIIEPQIIRSLAKEFDDEALRVIKLMPKWKPGLINGKPVKVVYTLPINFQGTAK